MRDVLLGVLLLLNVVTLLLFAFDKLQSRRQGARRIRERTLLWCVFLGGCVGAWVAISLFRHKTVKQPFRIFAILWTLLSPAWLVVFWPWLPWSAA